MLKLTGNRKIIGYLFALAAGSVLLFFSNEPGYAKSTEKGWLGVGISELTPSIRRDAGLEDQKGLLITKIYEDSPAEEAGLQEDDIILSYDGKGVQYMDELIDLVLNTSPGSKVKIEIFRDGKNLSKKVRIGQKKINEHHYSVPIRKRVIIKHERPFLGVHLQDLDKNLAGYFQVEEHKGVVITAIVENSPAEKAGLKSGDVIVKIGDEPIHYTEDVFYSIKKYDHGETVAVEIVRKAEHQTLDIVLETEEPVEIKIDRHGLHHDLDFDIDRFGDGDIDINVEELELDLDHIIDTMENRLEKLFDDIGI